MRFARGLPVQKLANSAVLAKVAVDLNYTDLEALHQAIGENHVSAQSVAPAVGRRSRVVLTTFRTDNP